MATSSAARTPAVSVVVCTHARSTALEVCLRHVLAHQTEVAWELVVVDNASPDNTAAVAQIALAGASIPSRLVTEPKLGLSHARNRGAQEALGAVLAFLDDDAFPHEGWLDALVAAFRDPAVSAAGGPIDPRFDGPLPEWLGPRYLPYLSAWDRGPAAHDLTYNEYPRGANLAIRARSLEAAGPFSPHLGRSGTRLASCEEIELCWRLEKLGGRVCYVPKARIDHVVPVGRLDAHWMARRFHWQGRSEAVMEWQHGGFRALLAGLRRNRENLARAVDPLERCFARAARIGYRFGSAEALLVPRWRPATRT